MSDWWKTEDWWAVWIGLLVFVLSLGTVGGLDLLGWGVATQDSWLHLDKAMAPGSACTTRPCPAVVSLIADLPVPAGGAERRGLVPGARPAPLHPRLHGHLLASATCACCSGITPTSPPRPNKRAGARASPGRSGLTGEAGYIIALLAGLVHRQLLARAGRLAQGGGPAGVVHQDGHRHPGGVARRQGGGAIGLTSGDHVPRLRGHRRGVPDLLGPGLLRRPQVLQVQPRVGGPAGLGHLDLRRVGGHRHRGRHPRPAGGADHGLVARRHLRGGRVAAPAVRSPRPSCRTSRWSPPPGWAWRSRPTGRPSPAGPSPRR